MGKVNQLLSDREAECCLDRIKMAIRRVFRSGYVFHWENRTEKCKVICKDLPSDLLDDLSQQGFLQLYIRLDDDSHPIIKNHLSYSWTIGTNLAINYLAARIRTVDIDDIQIPVNASPETWISLNRALNLAANDACVLLALPLSAVEESGLWAA